MQSYGNVNQQVGRPTSYTNLNTLQTHQAPYIQQPPPTVHPASYQPAFNYPPQIQLPAMNVFTPPPSLQSFLANSTTYFQSSSPSQSISFQNFGNVPPLLQQQLKQLYEKEMQEIYQVTDFKEQQLPFTRIRKIMKSDEDVRVSS